MNKIGWLLVGVLFSGNTNNGDHAGFGYANTNNTSSNASANVSSQLWFSQNNSTNEATTLPIGRR
jgi:hypothetical protein|nr:MAG TPA: hypothetical protein [Bacteriophage sp.]